MRVFNLKTESFPADGYVGCWFDGNCRALPIALYISEDSFWIASHEENCCSESVFCDRTLSFNLQGDVYSERVCEEIYTSFKAEIKCLQASYREVYDGNNYRGKWDETLVDDLREKLRDFELDWVEDEVEE